MRLTLRTLLSYLDNVLDEPARAELQRQIEASEHASEWVHRTRDVMRRLKLGAPEPEGAGSIDDPNTVAEYLDRTLPEEGVAEFERVCLESDAMLAEVASCHHVLAMFLSEPAEIDPDTRNRLHRLEADLATALKSRVEGAHRPAADAEPVAVPPPSMEPQPGRRAGSRQRQAEVAEESGGFWSDLVPWIPAIAALVLLSATAFLVLNNETAETVARGNGEQATVVDPEKTKPDVETTPEDGGEEVGALSSEEDKSTGAQAGAVTPDEPAEPGVVDDTTPEEGTNAAPDATTNDDMDESEKGTPPPVPTPAGPAGGATSADPEPESKGEPQEPEPAVEEAEPKAVVTYRGDPPPTDAPRSGPLSRLDPDGFVVVDSPGNRWLRLVNEMFLQAPQKGHVICMPAYRGAFEFSQGVLLELVDQTEVVIDPEKPSLELDYGRVVLSCYPTVEEPVEIAVRIDAVDYTLTLSPGASVAIATDRFYEPGRPMLTDAAPMVAIAHALTGEATWKTPTSERTSAMSAPLFYVSGSLSGAPQGFRDPAWVTSVALTDADLESSPYVAGQVDEEVLPQLLAMSDGKNSRETRDVVSLASRCAAALMQPDALVASFEDKAQAEEWGRNLMSLRQMASRSVAGAAAVQRAFVEKYGDAGGSALFELVQGFTPGQVGGDAAAVRAGVIPMKLLPMLESEDLATRVLGSLALLELVEYRQAAKDVAVADKRDRRTIVRRLERDIEDGELSLSPR